MSPNCCLLSTSSMTQSKTQFLVPQSLGVYWMLGKSLQILTAGNQWLWASFTTQESSSEGQGFMTLDIVQEESKRKIGFGDNPGEDPGKRKAIQ